MAFNIYGTSQLSSPKESPTSNFNNYSIYFLINFSKIVL